MKIDLYLKGGSKSDSKASPSPSFNSTWGNSSRGLRYEDGSYGGGTSMRFESSDDVAAVVEER